MSGCPLHGAVYDRYKHTPRMFFQKWLEKWFIQCTFFKTDPASLIRSYPTFVICYLKLDIFGKKRDFPSNNVVRDTHTLLLGRPART